MSDKKSYDPIEELFREGLQNGPYEYREADWNRMEAMLNTEARRKKILLWSVVSGLLAMIMALAFVLYPTSPQNQLLEQPSETEQIQEPITISPVSPEQTKASSKVKTEDVDIESSFDEERTPQRVLPTNKKVATPVAATSPNRAVSSKAAPAVTQKETPVQPVVSASTQEVTMVEAPSVTKESALSNDQNKLGESAVPTDTTLQKVDEINSVTIPADTLEYYMESSVNDSNSSPQVLTSTPSQSRNRDRGFFLGLRAGVDLSGTDLTNDPRWGYRYGVMMGYDFGPITIQTGILPSVVDYTAYGDEYQFPSWYYYQASKTIGTCTMYEIPLEVKWDISNHWSVLVGATSYYIDRQDYKFEYDMISSTGLITNYTHDEDTTQWFRHMHFGITRGWDFGRHRLELTPYYQIPLKGIGIGSVKWKSLGLQVQYRFILF